MKSFLKSLASALGSTNPVWKEPPVSLDQLQEMLEYAKRRNLCGSGTPKSGERKLGRSISIETGTRSFTLRVDTSHNKAGTVIKLYPSVTWSYMPHHLGLYLVDGKVEYRASHDGIGPRESMPLATDPEDMEEIRRCFDFWYNEFGLPESLRRPAHPPKQFNSTGDTMQDIETYLKDGSIRAFHELFEDGGPVIWVDWREEDDNIVRMAAKVLALDNLAARFENDSGDLLIIYRGTEHRICYSDGGVADRDTSIIALSGLLQPHHELRLCNASQGSDTLALLALSASDWSVIEHRHPAACAEHFMAIEEGREIFGDAR